MSFTITSFYDFIPLKDLENIKTSLLEFCNLNSIKGTILIASEGINSTISGTRKSIDKYYVFQEDLFDKKFTYKESFDYKLPFAKMKVKIKPEIVSMGILNLDINKRGNYIKPNEWDDFISRSDVILIDTRNNYEVALGSFENAIDPKTDNFRQLPDWINNNSANLQGKKIAMYCTGGIRCEKSTSYLKNKGYSEVYHLEGGILEYFKSTNNRNSKWKGSCFVFDERAVLDNDLKPLDSISCSSCSNQVTTRDIKQLKGTGENICFPCYKNRINFN